MQETVRAVDYRRTLIAMVMPIALANGTQEGKIAAMDSACAVDNLKEGKIRRGFCDEGRIHFRSEHVGRSFFRLTKPDIILQLAVQSFTYTMAWQPLLNACAHRRECASSAVGRMLRVVDFVLMRACKVNPVGKVHIMSEALGRKWPKYGERLMTQEIQRDKTWHVSLRLRHRGLPDFKSNGESFISNSLEKIPKGWISQDPPALLELYAQFYHPDMATAASRLLKTMKEACWTTGPILSCVHAERGTPTCRKSRQGCMLHSGCLREIR